jgi:hypothetical protein
MCGGLYRHEAENAKFLRESSDPLGLEPCAVTARDTLHLHTDRHYPVRRVDIDRPRIIRLPNLRTNPRLELGNQLLVSTAKGLLNVHPRDMVFSRGFRSISATNIKLEWAFCHISSVKCPTPKRLRLLRTLEVVCWP